MEHLIENVAQTARDMFARERLLPLKTDVTPAELAAHLKRTFNFEKPMDADQVYREVTALLDRESVHSNNPRYFGLFVPQVDGLTVAAEALTALYNPVVALWEFAPAAVEMEKHVLNCFLDRLPWDKHSRTAHFTTGGTESNHTAALCALSHAFPEYGARGLRALEGDPVFYVSKESHHSFQKIANHIGIGRTSVREVPVDADFRMQASALEQRIVEDGRAGKLPFMVVGTAGTTNAGVVDPMHELAAVCKRYGLWFHVDAAWAGAALISDRLQPHLAGIEYADSITVDAHKWLSMQAGSGIFLSRQVEAVRCSFRVETPYVPESGRSNEPSPYRATLQWTRRFIGLKLMMTLAVLGREGVAQRLHRQTELGAYLRKRLRSRGWRVVNDTPFPVVCFQSESGEPVAALYEEVMGSGRVWISKTILDGREAVLRACITGARAEESDVDMLMAELERARKKVRISLGAEPELVS